MMDLTGESVSNVTEKDIVSQNGQTESTLILV